MSQFGPKRQHKTVKCKMHRMARKTIKLAPLLCRSIAVTQLIVLLDSHSTLKLRTAGKLKAPDPCRVCECPQMFFRDRHAALLMAIDADAKPGADLLVLAQAEARSHPRAAQTPRRLAGHQGPPAAGARRCTSCTTAAEIYVSFESERWPVLISIQSVVLCIFMSSSWQHLCICSRLKVCHPRHGCEGQGSHSPSAAWHHMHL